MSDERVEVSVVLKPRQALSSVAPMSREEFASRFGADPSVLARVEAFARQHGLDVIESSQPRRTVVLGGSAADVAAAFGVVLSQSVSADGSTYRVPSGPVQLPPELQDVVQGVFGLDTRPVARPR